MSSIIEVDNQIEAEVDNSTDISVQSTVIDTEIKPSVEVEVQTQNFVITSDDIYIVNQTDTPPQWFQDLIDHQINSSDLADSVYDLQTTFDDFEDGYTHTIARLDTTDAQLVANVEALKLSDNEQAGAILHLEQTQITPEQVTTISEDTIGAWQVSGESAAWFNDKVSTVSSVAYAAATSASSLTAVVESQQSQLINAFVSIKDLEQQVDGKVETLFIPNTGGNSGPNYNATPNLNTTTEPYATWLADDTRSQHTGDTYVLYEPDGDGKKLISSWRFIRTVPNVPVTDADGFQWSIITDDIALQAYQAALQAQSTADGKITTYITHSNTEVPNMPHDSNNPDDAGDLWFSNTLLETMKMRRYDGLDWQDVSDERIQASVNRLDDVSVLKDGLWQAKSSLTVGGSGADGSAVGGFVVDSGNVDAEGNKIGEATSNFKIFADNFMVVNNPSDSGENLKPFKINTTVSPPVIELNGRVDFGNGFDSNGKTVITGDDVQTGSITSVAQVSGQPRMEINLDAGYIYIR